MRSIVMVGRADMPVTENMFSKIPVVSRIYPNIINKLLRDSTLLQRTGIT